MGTEPLTAAEQGHLARDQGHGRAPLLNREFMQTFPRWAAMGEYMRAWDARDRELEEQGA
ncbi:MAG: hypothetical protein ACREFZ_08900 [Acetobacteraceae bacterium]